MSRIWRVQAAPFGAAFSLVCGVWWASGASARGQGQALVHPSFAGVWVRLNAELSWPSGAAWGGRAVHPGAFGDKVTIEETDRMVTFVQHLPVQVVGKAAQFEDVRWVYGLANGAASGEAVRGCPCRSGSCQGATFVAQTSWDVASSAEAVQ